MNKKAARWAQLGAELRGYRNARGLSLDDVERDTGLDKSGMSRWERGLSRPRQDSLATLMDRYGLHAVERENLMILARYRTKDGDWLREKEPERPDDPLALIVQALQAGPWSEAVCAAVYALLAIPAYERTRVRREILDALNRRLSESAANYAAGPQVDAEALARVILTDALVEVFGPSGGRLPPPPAKA